MEVTSTQQSVIDFCHQPRTASEISSVLGVSRWYIYKMCSRGYLQNVGHIQSAAKYVSADYTPQAKRQKPKWTTQTAVLQVSSVWHYAERLK
jgi:hypothetical protein